MKIKFPKDLIKALNCSIFSQLCWGEEKKITYESFINVLFRKALLLPLQTSVRPYWVLAFLYVAFRNKTFNN